MKLSRQIRNSVAVTAIRQALKKVALHNEGLKINFIEKAKEGKEYKAFEAYLEVRYEGVPPERLTYHERELIGEILHDGPAENPAYLRVVSLDEVEALADILAPNFNTEKDLVDHLGNLIIE